MNGICLQDYVQDGVMKCAFAVPWWIVIVVSIAVVSIWAWRRL